MLDREVHCALEVYTNRERQDGPNASVRWRAKTIAINYAPALRGSPSDVNTSVGQMKRGDM